MLAPRLVDGTDYCLLATARDHKRAFDGNVGPNTGGMGALSPADNWNSAIHAQLDRSIMGPLLSGLKDEGILFRGLLFPGLMIEGTVPRVRVQLSVRRSGDPGDSSKDEIRSPATSSGRCRRKTGRL